MDEKEPTVTQQYLSSGPRGIRVSEDRLVVAIDFESMTAPGTAIRLGIPADQLGQLQAALAFAEKQLVGAQAGAPQQRQ